MTLTRMGALYKFHGNLVKISGRQKTFTTLLISDRPITYLYNTFHYYETHLRDKPLLKRKLVSSILGSLKEIKPPNFSLSEQYNDYIDSNGEDINWIPEINYYASLISRFVEGN